MATAAGLHRESLCAFNGVLPDRPSERLRTIIIPGTLERTSLHMGVMVV